MNKTLIVHPKIFIEYCPILGFRYMIIEQFIDGKSFNYSKFY